MSDENNIIYFSVGIEKLGIILSLFGLEQMELDAEWPNFNPMRVNINTN